MIKSIDLSGSWDFTLDPDKVGVEREFFNNENFSKVFDDTISLPGTTSMAAKGEPSDKRETGFLTDPYLFEGYAWYSKEISPGKELWGKNIFLHLERTRKTYVWIDGRAVGEQDSLNTPHHYDITKYVGKQPFRLTIMVSNVDYKTGGGHLTSPDTQSNWNGILGEISLQIYNDIYIEHIKTMPNIETKSVDVEIHTVNKSFTDRNLSVCAQASLMDINGDTGIKTGKEIFENLYFPAGNGVETFTYQLGDDASLWSEYNPVVYLLQLTIPESDELASTTFGLRKFSTTETKFLINDTPVFLRGKHDGLVFPQTGAVPADVSSWIRVMSISKSYGINHYRFHTCCPPEAAFVAADFLGIYMEPQLPFWGTLTAPGDEGHNEEEQQYLISEGFRMMKEFGNHPSFCMMSLGNELWGSKERMAQIITDYRKVDDRHLYTQGSNNFQHTPVLLPEDDFYVGVRFSKDRLIRGSYGMCDAPLGHIQWEAPSANHNYDEMIFPTDKGNDHDATSADAEEIEIQYGTGVKKVKAASSDGPLVPHIPVVTHEIGQFAVYPNFREIEKYTGVLKARNFEVFRERLEEKGMLDQADDFFYTSGKLSVQCYKEELEAAARSKYVAGYQILDIQDFPGQGTALVGILDAFMDSKGHVTPEEWSGYCSDHILLAEFDRFVFEAGETLNAKLAIRYYNPKKLESKHIHYELRSKSVDLPLKGSLIASGDVIIPDGTTELARIGDAKILFPDIDKPEIYDFTLSVPDTDMANSYEIYCYPKQEVQTLSTGEYKENIFITNDFEDACCELKKGKNVLFLPNEIKEFIEGFYCTDFWCYPMFRDICEWMKKPVAVGTMGLLINKNHPALSEFPSHKYCTPQWYNIISHSDMAILDDVTDKDYRPILQMVDNFERNHKLGLLFEGKAYGGKILICTCRLSEIQEKTEVKQFIKSILDYISGSDFNPDKELDMERLKKIFI